MGDAEIERAYVPRSVTVRSQDNSAVVDGARKGVHLREVGAAIHVVRVGEGIIQACL